MYSSRNLFYGLITSVTNKFIEHRSLECVLVNMLILLSKYKDELRLPQPCLIDNNFKRIFTEPKVIYQVEFDRYMYLSDYDTNSDYDISNESKIENFNEYYQTLAPSKEKQLDRLKRNNCLMPYKDQACNCWL